MTWYYTQTKTLTLEKDSIVEYIRRITAQTDVILAIYGKKNSGKSWAAISLCEDLDPLFCKDDICASLETFFEQMTDKEKRRGNRAVLLDDFGSEMDANEFKSDPNIATNHFFQKSRTMHNAYIITTPNRAFITKTMRDRLCDYYLEMDGKNPVLGLSYVKVQEIQINSKTGKTYYHRLRLNPDGTVGLGTGGNPIGRFGIFKPTQTLRDWYIPYREKIADMQLDKSAKRVLGNKEVIDGVEKLEGLANQILEAGSKYIKKRGNRTILKKELVHSALGVSTRDITGLQDYMINEGYLSE